MSPLHFFSAAITFLAVVVWNCRLRRRLKGPTMWPIVGYLPSLALHFEHLHEWVAHFLISNGGTARLHGPWKRRILTADPANIEYVVRTKYGNFVKGESFKESFRDIFGDSYFLQDGESFIQVNKSVGRALASAGFRNTAAVALPAAVHRRLLPLLRQACEKGAVIDLQDIFVRLVFDMVCEVGLGTHSMSLSSDFPLPRVPYLEQHDQAMKVAMFRMVVPTLCWKAMRYFNIGLERRLRRAVECMHGFIDKIFSPPLPGDADAGTWNIMSAFLRFERESGREYSQKEIVSATANLIMAGMDTVASALTWFFWVLAQHPDVEAKILAEIRRIVKKRPDPDSRDEYDPSPLDPEELKQMHYLHAALTESLRLYPSVPVDITEAVEDDVLPSGTRVEKGSQVIYSMYSLGRMEKVWGEDCGEFKPERWLKDERFVKESDFKFSVFNGGPRSCIGRELAYWQMKMVVASVISRYQVEKVDKLPVVLKYRLSLSMKNGLRVTIRPRVEGYHKTTPN